MQIIKIIAIVAVLIVCAVLALLVLAVLSFSIAADIRGLYRAYAYGLTP